MAKHLDWIFAGLAVAAGVGLVRALRCEPTVRTGETMFLFGDSLAVGLDPFVRKLAQERGIGYSSQSKGGTTMRNWLAQATSLRAAMAPAQAVFISLGTNDTYSNLTPEELRKDAETILALARENGRRVLWLLPPKLPKQDRATPEIKATGVDVFESALIDIPMGGDLIHPTGTGYAMWAGLMWRQATCGDEKPPQVAAGMMPARPPSWLKRVPSPDRVRTIRARRRR